MGNRFYIEIEGESKEALLKELLRYKKLLNKDIEENECNGDCENCENFVSEEDIDLMKGKVIAYHATISTLLREKELIPISVINEYNATLIDLQDYLDDEDEDDEDEDT